MDVLRLVIEPALKILTVNSCMIYVSDTVSYPDHLPTIPKTFERSDCVPKYLQYEIEDWFGQRGRVNIEKSTLCAENPISEN